MDSKYDIIKKIKVLQMKLEEIENNEKNIEHFEKKECKHRKVYKYVLKKMCIYTCKKCKKNLEEEEIKNSLIKIRSLV